MGMIPIAKPLLGKEEEQAVLEVLRSGCIARGPVTEAFEKEFAEFCGAPYAVATSSGTTALELIVQTLGIGQGDEVITTPFSFMASTSCIFVNGALPTFCDIDPLTYNIDPKGIEELITPRTKAILLVHLYGQPAEMDEIMAIAEKHNLLVIEDACQAHGATYKGHKVGSFGDAAAFSFYPTKNMATAEGGIALFRDAAIAKKASMLHAHGSAVRYKHELIGHNYRTTDLAMAICREQLKKLPRFNEARQRNAAYFLENITNTKVQLPVIAPDRTHVFHQFTVRISEPNNPLANDDAAKRLQERGIGTGVHYPRTINEQSALTLGFGVRPTNTQNAVRAAREVLSIPVHPGLSEEDRERIVEGMNAL